VPAYREDGFDLFESGAIVLWIGERSESLLPRDPKARARAMQWCFAALNSVEPHFMNLATIDVFHKGEDWATQRRPAVAEMVRRRIAQVAAALGDRPWLDGAQFTAGDLLMCTVMRMRPDHVDEQPTPAAWRDRCMARPAFAGALAAQLADFDRAAA
jgi:glutathione S-transferase